MPYGTSLRITDYGRVALALFALMLMSTPQVTRAKASAPQTSQKKIADMDLAEARRAFLEDSIAPTIKPKGYDVIIVEYMDYQCPSCRASLVPLKQLLQKDKKVRVIFRDWPIFGAASEQAARVAIASQWQGKHTKFHDALMTVASPLTEVKIKAAAKKAGVDWPRLEKDLKMHSLDIEALLERNDDQAQELGLEGTPEFIIGNVQSFGGMDLPALSKAVGRARRELKDPKRIVPSLPEGI